MCIGDGSSDVCSSDLNARGGPRLDQHDQSQTQGRKGSNLIGLHRSADEAARFWRHWKTSRFDPGNTGGAVPAPFTQGITAVEKVAFDGRSVRVSPRVGRRCVVADEPDDLLTSRPGVLGGLPLL